LPLCNSHEAYPWIQVSYFEAFCKDHFASILNIEPRLLENLKRQGQDITIDSAQLLLFDQEWSCKLGFLIAEKYDFGTAQKINALYCGLLKISPFSKDEANFYEQFLRDRNLLVHHGGIYTSSYLQQQKTTDSEVRNRAFSHSLVVTKDYFMDRLSFIGQISRKLLKASHSSLTNYLRENSIECTVERRKAIDSFLWWGKEKI
jgi:hypothetical protein